MSWDATWPITTGVSLELDAFGHRRANHALDAPGNFCARTESYDGGSNFGTPGWDGGICGASAYTGFLNGGAEAIDIVSTGTTLFSRFQTSTNVDIGFNFPFFGTTTSEVWVTSDGFLTLSSSSFDPNNVSLPSTLPPASLGIIAPFWDEVYYAATGGSVLWETRLVGGKKVAVFDWNEVNRRQAGDPLSFQAQLWDNGRIIFVYRRVAGTNPLTFGASATVGIQEPSSSSPGYLLYSFNEESLVEDLVIEFVPN